MHRVTGKIGYRGNVWEYDEDDGEKVWEYSVGWALSCEDRETFKSRHGAIMPWQLAFDLIRTYSRPGKLVLDVCGGTGTTGVAALMTGRKYLLFEPWDEAVYHARRRLANMARKLGTPQPPKCESSQVSEPTPPHADSGDDAPNDG
jgi:DNA modification methylase